MNPGEKVFPRSVNPEAIEYVTMIRTLLSLYKGRTAAYPKRSGKGDVK
jgi:hypothetical protein